VRVERGGDRRGGDRYGGERGGERRGGGGGRFGDKKAGGPQGNWKPEYVCLCSFVLLAGVAAQKILLTHTHNDSRLCRLVVALAEAAKTIALLTLNKFYTSTYKIVSAFKITNRAVLSLENRQCW
jgi:hypothetical protein